MSNPRRVETLIAVMVLSAVGMAGYTGIHSHALHPALAVTIFALAALTSRLKVKLPGINGNMSMNLPFLLTAIVNLSAAEAMIVAGVSTLVQCWPQKGKKPNLEQVAFNVSMMVFASCISAWVFNWSWGGGSKPTAIGLATGTLLLGQTVPVSAAISLSEGKAMTSIWWNVAQLSFPYYVVSAGITSMVQVASVRVGWPLALAVFPVMYGVYRSYRMYFGKMAEMLRQEVTMKAAAASA
jgi:hypothetical protein